MIWCSAKQEVRGEIMNTDVLVEILYTEGEAILATKSLAEVFALFRDFAKRYSRFVSANELWQFNTQESGSLSPELFDILETAASYHRETAGLFDPSILASLETAGYVGAYQTSSDEAKGNFSALILNPADHSFTKPKNLTIDLGGIGKGYIIDKVARFLQKRFANFLVDAGGDIFVQGVNEKEGYPYWAIDIEHPLTHARAATLLLRNMAVTTSGRNRRRWLKGDKEQHHLINPFTNESASFELLSVTALAENTVRADVLAKTLFIAGKERGPVLAEKLSVPALFFDHTGHPTHNQAFTPYIWQP